MILRLLARLPRAWPFALTGALAWLAWALRIRRRVVMANLELAFPEKTAGERRRIARRTYRQLGKMAAEFALVTRMSQQELERLLTFENFAAFEEARARGRGVVACTAHFGNWELLQAGCTLRGIPISSITRPQSSARADSMIKRARREAGVEDLGAEKGETLKAALRALRQGRVLGYVIDQNVSRRRAVFPTFFGVPAATSPTPAVLAIRNGAAVVFALAVPDEGGRYRVVIEGPLEVPRSGDRDRDVLAFMQDLNDRLERHIRLHPHAWYWLHRRWKTRPE